MSNALVGVQDVTDADLVESLQKNIEILSSHPRCVPFWAYTWGRRTQNTDLILHKKQIVPILITGGKNYSFNGNINREFLK